MHLLHLGYLMQDILSSKGIIRDRKSDTQAQQHKLDGLVIKDMVSKTKTLQLLVDGPLKLQAYAQRGVAWTL